MPRGPITWLVVPALLVLAARAQEPVTDPQVLFRSGVELVQIDVSVLDDDRRPVRGLTAADFTVFDDGEPRPIVTFSEVTLPAPEVPTAPWIRDVVPDVATNAPTEGGRLVVILLDRSIPFGLPTITAREIATAAVEELGPNDLAAVIFTGAGTPQNFTSDRDLLLRAINESDPSSTPSRDALEMYTSQAVDLLNAESGAGSLQHGGCYCGICVPQTIAHVAETLRDVPRRKSLLFIGTNVEFQSAEIDCGYRLDRARTRMMQALDLANVTIHSFDPVGLEVVSPSARASSSLRRRSDRAPLRQVVAGSLAANLNRQGSLEVLPDRTGGRTVINTNAPARAMGDVFAESSTYYLLAFEADADDRGRVHEIEVKTNQRDVRVQSRRRYTLDDVASTSGPLAAAVAESVSRATTATQPVADIPLSLAVAPFAVPGSTDVDLIAVIGMRYPLTPAAAVAGEPAVAREEEIRVLAGAFDRFARPRASDARALVLSLTPEAAGELRFESLSRLLVRPGVFEIRLGASSSSGEPSGSVFTHVDVPSFRRDPVSLSGLVLEADPGWQVAADDVLTGRLPVTPTSRRDFLRMDRVTAFVRAYQGGDDPLRSVTATVRLTTDLGRVALDRTLNLDPAAFDVDRAADIQVDLPLTNLDPGEHLLSIEVQAGESEARRDLRFTVR